MGREEAGGLSEPSWGTVSVKMRGLECGLLFSSWIGGSLSESVLLKPY